MMSDVVETVPEEENSEGASSTKPLVESGKGGLTSLVDTMPIHVNLKWTKEDVVEFKLFWSEMKKMKNDDTMVLGVTILIWMIEHIKGAKKFFHVYDSKQTRERTSSGTKRKTKTVDDRFMNHAIGIVMELNKTIGQLPDMEEFTNSFKRIARIHAENEDFRDNFHLFLAELMEVRKESRPATMWYQLFDALIDVYRTVISSHAPYLLEDDRSAVRCCSVS